MSDHPPWKYYRVLIEDVPGDADYLDDFPEDVEIVVKALARYGFEASRPDACRLWQLYSDDLSAGWISMQRDNYEWIFYCVSRFFEVKVHPVSVARRFDHAS